MEKQLFPINNDTHELRWQETPFSYRHLFFYLLWDFIYYVLFYLILFIYYENFE